MKNISFAATIPQIMNRSKTVTRRLKWERLLPGQRLRAVEKCMGLKKGERVCVLAEIEIISVSREPLAAITAEDVVAEGFPHWTPSQFIEFFCRSMKVTPERELTRIEFHYA